MDLTLIPPDDIDADALLRDRTRIDPGELAELTHSIFVSGLRSPIEVWRLPGAETPPRYGLIAGLRRLTAFRALQDWPRPERFATIPAFVVPAPDLPAAMAAMVTENEVRSPITPWEKGLLIDAAVRADLFPTTEAAVDALYPAASRQKRSRLRMHALVVSHCDGLFTTPERLSQSQMDRLATALRGNLADVVDHVLTLHRGDSLQTQWQALLPVLAEALDPDPDGDTAPAPASGRPRRLLRLTGGRGLTLRRERTRTGWALHFTGPEARKSGLMDDVMDKVEFWFGQQE
jgi:ParB family transcriptional regulator, chromosome partitioning protein